MQFDATTSHGAAVITPGGDGLDLHVAAEFRAALLQVIAAGQHRVVVDLAQVRFIDSSALGALVTALKAVKARDQAGDIRLANVQALIVEVLAITRLSRVLSSYPSVDAAVHSF